MSEPTRAVTSAASSRKPARSTTALRAGPNALQRLQAMAGNRAVTALVAQRLNAGGGAECVAAPVAPTASAPAQDPQFAAAKKDIDAKSGALKTHPPAATEVRAAQNAAVAPADDKEAQAKAAHTGKMEAAKPGGFDKAAFVAAVNAAVAAKAPKNLDEADKFAQSGKADQVKNEVMGKVTAGKDSSAKAIKDTTEATPDVGAAKDKPVTPLPAATTPVTPAAPDPKALAPKVAPAEQTRLGAGSCETTKAMADAGVTDEQLAKSGEPEFTGALEAKKAAQAHDATAPGVVRRQEGQIIADAAAGAASVSKAGLGAMTAAKGGALHAAGAGKQETKSKDEGERARIAGEIKKIFDKTKTDVEGILSGLDKTVSDKFEDGERKAKEAFTADHQARMSKYKWSRYGGFGGAALWVKDQFLDLPAEANALFQESKKLYETKMQAVIGDIADTVGAELARAKARVAEGRTQVQKFVADQPKNLQQLAGDAAKEIGSQFEDLEKSIDEKQSSLVDELADKYAAARNAVDEEIKKLQEENKGLVGQAASAITGAVETIKKLKDMLLGVLARAANAVEKIIKDPMDFLAKFINAVKAGVTGFVSNIATHLKKGLQGWLFGTLAEAGIEIPEKFDLKGIISLLLSLLGLTWTSIRARIVKVVGEKAMGMIEKGVDFIKVIVTEGLPGVWKFIAQKLTDLKEQVMGQIRDFVITKVITAGVTWLISLLNPAAAFIKACKMIYDAVMWFVDNAERLKEFVDSVLDSVESIAAGGVGKVAALIESTMAKTVPMIISGLASLLGLGGIASKIKSILEKVQAPVGKAVDWLIGKAVKYGKKFLDKLKKSKLGKAFGAAKDKAKAAYAKGKAYVKKKYEAGKAWVKGKYEKGKKWVKKQGEKVSGFLKKKCDELMAKTFSSTFAADKESHRLYTTAGQPETLYVASAPSKLVAAFTHLESPALRKEIADLDSKFRSRMKAYKEKVSALRKLGDDWAAKDPTGVKAKLAEISSERNEAQKIQEAILEFAKKNMSGGPGTHAPGIGNIAPHGAQLGRLRGTKVKSWAMESEHVIPDAIVRRLIMAFSREGKTTKDDTVYNAQPTILLYRGAAKAKTGGTPWDAQRGQDQDLIIRMGNITAMVRARVGGDEAGMRKVSSGRQEAATPKYHWRTYLEDQYNRRLKPAFLSVAEQALSRTKAAVKREQKMVGRFRGQDADARPTDSEIEAAHQAQKTHIDTLVEQRLNEAGMG